MELLELEGDVGGGGYNHGTSCCGRNIEGKTHSAKAS
jgi:hypothetical protein